MAAGQLAGACSPASAHTQARPPVCRAAPSTCPGRPSTSATLPGGATRSRVGLGSGAPPPELMQTPACCVDQCIATTENTSRSDGFTSARLSPCQLLAAVGLAGLALCRAGQGGSLPVGWCQLTRSARHSTCLPPACLPACWPSSAGATIPVATEGFTAYTLKEPIGVAGQIIREWRARGCSLDDCTCIRVLQPQRRV